MVIKINRVFFHVNSERRLTRRKNPVWLLHSSLSTAFGLESLTLSPARNRKNLPSIFSPEYVILQGIFSVAKSHLQSLLQVASLSPPPPSSTGSSPPPPPLCSLSYTQGNARLKPLFVPLLCFLAEKKSGNMGKILKFCVFVLWMIVIGTVQHVMENHSISRIFSAGKHSIISFLIIMRIRIRIYHSFSCIIY